MEILKNVHAKNIVEWAKDKPNTFLLSADLTSSVEAHLFRDAYPDRFLSMGIAEQNMLAFAGGMAREGLIPMVHTFAVFIYRRAYDQISMSVAYPNLPVKMFGFLPGVMTPGGATHQAIEDISVMRSLPNMTIIECGDATDVESCLDVAYSVDGPVYVRVLRGEIPRLFSKNDPMVLGKIRTLHEGDDLVLLTSGICTEEGMRAVSAMEDHGINIQHYHVSTLKPFDHPEIVEKIEKSKYGCIVLENHSIIGGLGTIIAEQMAKYGCSKKLYKMGLNDVFVHGASYRYLMRENDIDAMALVAKIESIVGQHFGIREEDLEETYTPADLSDAKPEAL